MVFGVSMVILGVGDCLSHKLKMSSFFNNPRIYITCMFEITVIIMIKQEQTDKLRTQKKQNSKKISLFDSNTVVSTDFSSLFYFFVLSILSTFIILFCITDYIMKISIYKWHINLYIGELALGILFMRCNQENVLHTNHKIQRPYRR